MLLLSVTSFHSSLTFVCHVLPLNTVVVLVVGVVVVMVIADIVVSVIVVVGGVVVGSGLAN